MTGFVSLAIWGIFLLVGWLGHRPVICAVSGLCLLAAAVRRYAAERRERSAQRLWADFARDRGAPAEYPYQRWIFQNRPGGGETAARMVLSGRICGESYPAPCFAAGGQPLPETGQYNVVCDGKRRAVCVVRTVSVTRRAFSQVSRELAVTEGYGSPEEWRAAKRPKFERLCAMAGIPFETHTEILFERFEVVYPTD